MTDSYTIRIDQFLAYAPAQVWKALTDAKLLARWLMPNNFQLAIGHRFTFKSVPMPGVKFDGIINCEVLDFEVERKLAISWADSGEENGLQSTVTWRLEPEGEGTHLFMEHAGFDEHNPHQMMGYKIMSQGWGRMSQRIEEILAEESKNLPEKKI